MYKVEKYLQTVTDPPPTEILKARLGKIVVLVDSTTANLAPNKPDAVEKAVQGRLSVCREASKPLPPAVRADLLLSDPFCPDVFSTDAVQDAMASKPTIPVHIQYVRPSEPQQSRPQQHLGKKNVRIPNISQSSCGKGSRLDYGSLNSNQNSSQPRESSQTFHGGKKNSYQ